MRSVLCRFLGGLLLLGAVSGLEGQESEPNSLSPEERAQGWRLLFDGETLEGWRAYRGEEPPEGWGIEHGALVLDPEEGGGDLITEEEFGDFQLSLEWRISPGGNSGIFFRVSEDRDAPWETGPEMQVLDNERHPDGRRRETSAGSNFALHAPARDVTRPVGEWNQARVVVRGSHVEHWLNGVKLLEYELWSQDWEARLEASKFSSMEGYGRNTTGHIVLQDHGNPVWYRSIKILPLGPSRRESGLGGTAPRSVSSPLVPEQA